MHFTVFSIVEIMCGTHQCCSQLWHTQLIH